jgi:hypothetical protein
MGQSMDRATILWCYPNDGCPEERVFNPHGLSDETLIRSIAY